MLHITVKEQFQHSISMRPHLYSYWSHRVVTDSITGGFLVEFLIENVTSPELENELDN